MQNILSISELTGRIKGTLESNFDSIVIRGEISNYKAHSSGHKYFSLKDEGAQISCVIWRSAASKMNFSPENGMKVVAEGGISVFAPRGNYQINITNMKPDGLGELYLAYEKLKNDLEESGWFNHDLKKQIPNIPLKIGISTSPTGAAVRDIISTIKRRFNSAEIVFRPTIVQGSASSNDIVNAIKDLSEKKPDLIIIGRGGGSIEDLWAYNTYEVAESIFNCEIPIISGVGHETDFTIADFVSDIRAATPTAAAEIATPKTKDYLNDILISYNSYFKDKLSEKIKSVNEIIEQFTGERVKNSIKSRINYEVQKLDNLETLMQGNYALKFERIKNKLNSLNQTIFFSNPHRPLEKGYALLKKGDKIIGKSESIKSYKEFDILRLNETAKVKLAKVFPKEMF
ncbi:exodeoxyribonuclease VII large subunit [Candidatus Kapabacteria bacterium]|nr:exodeoxyribonuclease VII large subunit [Candidatus Kapabacteria bacterium]